MTHVSVRHCFDVYHSQSIGVIIVEMSATCSGYDIKTRELADNAVFSC